MPFPPRYCEIPASSGPWAFDGCGVETRDVTLLTGDYAVPTACTHDPDSDTYHPRFAVERKSGDDFLTALTWERDRFTSELRRAAEWPQPLAVVVEISWEALLRTGAVWHGGISIQTRSSGRSRRGHVTTTSRSVSPSPVDEPSCVRFSCWSVTVSDDMSKSDANSLRPESSLSVFDLTENHRQHVAPLRRM